MNNPQEKIMNYASPYTPNYAAPAAAYAQSYDPNAYAYAQAQQHAAALEQVQQMYGGQQQYPMVITGQTTPPVGALPPKLTPLQGAWWQEPMYGVPRWGIAATALALTGIGLAWKAGVFGGMKANTRTTTRTTARRSTARDSDSASRKTSAYGDERDVSRTRTTTRTRSRRRPSGARGRSVGARHY